MRSKIRHIAAGSKILLRYFSTEADWHRAWYWKRIYGKIKYKIRTIVWRLDGKK